MILKIIAILLLIGLILFTRYLILSTIRNSKLFLEKYSTIREKLADAETIDDLQECSKLLDELHPSDEWQRADKRHLRGILIGMFDQMYKNSKK